MRLISDVSESGYLSHSIATGFVPNLSNSQIFLIARFAASDKLYRMHKPSISLSINAFCFSLLLMIINPIVPTISTSSNSRIASHRLAWLNRGFCLFRFLSLSFSPFWLDGLSIRRASRSRVSAFFGALNCYVARESDDGFSLSNLARRRVQLVKLANLLDCTLRGIR